MRAAGDVAKADYIGKMMDRTRRIGLPKDIWTRIFILNMLGMFLWFFTMGVLVLWNGFGALTRRTEHEEGFLDDAEEINMLQCIGQAFGFTRVDAACARTVYSLAGWGVIASLASFWWNPILQRRNIDRTVGLGEFYKLQVILLSARIGVWYMLGNQEQHNFDPSIVRAVHATMLGMNIGVPILAYNTARIAKPPRISFQDNYQPLSDHVQSNIQRFPNSSPLSVSHSRTIDMSENRAFPFSKVNASQSSKPQLPPESQLDDDLDEFDAMDIDTPPPKHNFRPTSNRMHKTVSQKPSPFYGKVPPAPISQEHRLRNPPNKPTFQKTSSERQERFFQSMTESPSQITNAHPDPPIDFHMQAPRLITAQDRQETGLEGWFSSKVFSLGDSGVVGDDLLAVRLPSATTLRTSGGQYSQCLPIALLLLAIGTWYQVPTLISRSLVPYYAAISLGAVVAGTRLANMILGPIINGSDVLLCIVELCGAAALAYQIQQAVLSGFSIAEALGSFPLLFFGFMILQECVILLTRYKASQMRSSQQGEAAISGANPLPSTREKEHLPLDKGTPLFQQYTPTTSRIQASTNSFTTQSPNSTGLAGLSLSLGDSSSQSKATIKSTQQTTRVLRGRVPKPWEVGGV